MIHTLPPSLPMTRIEEEDEEVCEPQEVFKRSAKFLEGGKISVLHFLNKVWVKYNIKICYGFQTDNPSQKNHPRLYPTGLVV